jgi:DNA-binding CsgD family transcriptional regulator/sugar-specific transcriptional regulator TrmB
MGRGSFVQELWGISAHGERVYRAMLSGSGRTVADIATHLGVTEQQVHEGLDELADLEMVRRSADSAVLPRPISPQAVLAALVARSEAEIVQRRRQIEATTTALEALAAEQQASRGGEVLVRLEGVDTVRVRLEELSATVRHEVVSVNPGTAQKPEAKAASRPLNQQMLARGVSIRCVYQDSYRNDRNLVAYAEWLTGLGGQIRMVPTLPTLMVIYDAEIALLPLDPADTTLGAVEVRSPGVVNAATALFEQLWAVGRPISADRRADESPLDPLEQALLRLLAAGITDDAAARRLGLSRRTITRMMSEITERLGATSRFQAGIKAAQRGWLDDRADDGAPAG